jgi:putative phosphoribosyl transferase
MRAPNPQEIKLPLSEVELVGDLTPAARGCGVVVFAHGSGSGRQSPRNRYVAYRLAQEGFGTLLFDLLTPAEDTTPRKRFDIPLLARRLSEVVAWVKHTGLGGNGIGLFGASTGSAAALITAAGLPADIRAVVSRGGRPDLAADYLARVRAPTLLIVGGNDRGVIELNESAYGALSCERDLRTVPDATHLFEEPGALDQVATLAVQWFERYLTAAERGLGAAAPPY